MEFDKFPTNGPVDSWVFMPAERRVGPLLHACGMTPNMVTTLSLLAGLVALMCIWLNRPLEASALLVVFYILDCADGIMARTYSQCSDFGEVYDFLKDFVFFIAFSSVNTMKMGTWLVPAAACLGLYLLAWEGVMGCRACHRREGHYDFYADKVRRRLWRPYLVLMWLSYRLGRPIVNWPLHWIGSGEVVFMSLLLLLASGLSQSASGP